MNRYRATDITGKIVEYFEAENIGTARLWAVENLQKIPGFWYVSEANTPVINSQEGGTLLGGGHREQRI